MNTEILKRLTDEQLHELKAATEKELANRYDYSILPGRTGWFISSNDGRRVEVVVQRINGKSVSCVEVANIRAKWRVSPECLTMDGISRSPEKRYQASPKPSQDYGQTAW
ncbi:hypothetical protein ACNAUY_07975 [Acinetobacter tibetensis]|uniref:hypothetical protein n=1 Tax=Acinetobacter tibetensis TaxID=2943497 RepID=UPI003A4DF392